jgi:hypothetical protein
VVLARIFGLALSALASFLTVAGCTLFLLPVSSAAIVAHPTLGNFASSICVRRRKLSKPQACPLSAPYRNSRLLEQDGEEKDTRHRLRPPSSCPYSQCSYCSARQTVPCLLGSCYGRNLIYDRRGIGILRSSCMRPLLSASSHLHIDNYLCMC